MEPLPLALVLSGAAALGAYQVGVLDHLLGELGGELGAPPSIDILSGTSAGAINAAALASGAAHPTEAVGRLADAWTGLQLERVLRPSAIELLAMVADVGAAPARLQRALAALGARGGLVDTDAIERLCVAAARPARIQQNLEEGRLLALAVAATQVATGQATVFHQGRARLRLHAGPSMVDTRIGPRHVLASAAVPLLFPAVTIDGELYCDGGLRHLVPLSPALHLGARRVLMVSATSAAAAGAQVESARRSAAGSPLYLAGKALDALFTDGVDSDLDRMLHVNALLEAGRRRFGPSFAAQLDGELAAMGVPPVRPIEVVHLRPSCDLGALAAEYVASAAAARRMRGGVARAFRRLIDRDPVRAGGVLAYLLFDGGFAGELIALGRADARARHAELRALVGGAARAA
ncbi:MAG TPA: patatin-like phospholipase family protein [Kofleriaceae bacterium]|nr:patatin-like phospholipase family protein [Kofleriaceae bacterium]